MRLLHRFNCGKLITARFKEISNTEICGFILNPMIVVATDRLYDYLCSYSKPVQPDYAGQLSLNVPLNNSEGKSHPP